MDLLSDLLKWLFVPSDNFFNDNIEDIKTRLSQKIPYQDYVNLFEDIKNVTNGETLSVDLPEYKVADNLVIKKDKFIDFGKITKYKDTWYSWVRGFTFIFMIIYNINQITKFLRGINVADGATAMGLERSRGGKEK